MKSIPKLLRRFIGILLLSSMLILVLNFVLLAAYVSSLNPNANPWKTAASAAKELKQDENNCYYLPENLLAEINDSNAWAIFIDDTTKTVVWQTDNLPESIPMSYTISDIANLTRGYIDGYPTFTGETADGLVVLGYPKTSFWKHMWPSWDYKLIANFPQTVLAAIFINVSLIFIIYFIVNSKLLKSVNPIINGIQSLHLGNSVFVPEKGVLSELAMNINKTSEILQSQKSLLRKKETARANWIAGVSHDIRTPLSMVMGYADQLSQNPILTDEDRKKATVIVTQSNRIKNLVNDLNLASKLEYNMQPVSLTSENIVAIARQAAVDFINIDPLGKYPVNWETDESLTSCFVNADKNLIMRAINNLILNCVNHNEQGCSIYIRVTKEKNMCIIEIEDDGIGASDHQIAKLNNAPHYMVCDDNTNEQRHGLGLLIVKQIATVHGGSVVIGKGRYGGFYVGIGLPCGEKG